MRLYHFVPAEYGIQNIERRRLKIATLDQLNDPFEMLAVAPKSAEHRAAFRRTKSQMAKQAGLLCFSRKWDNPVQWSHYARNHTGLCLGFDVADALVKPVDCRTKRVAFDPVILEDEEQGRAFIEGLSCIKFAHWKYENEVRVFVALDSDDTEGGLYFMCFSSQLALREVIIGAVSEVTRAELAGEVHVCNARLAFKTFRVVTQQSAKLWR